MNEMKITDKSTKAQIMEAYRQAKEELDKLKEMKDLPVEKAKAEALEASLKNAEVAASNKIFSDEIVKQYTDLKAAIEEYSKELQDLYGIRSEADSLAVMINAHKAKVAEMEADYERKKADLSSGLETFKEETKEKIAELSKSVVKAKKEADEEISEYNASLAKQRQREIDEYEYDLKIAHKKDADNWKSEKACREMELQKKADEIKEREDALSAKEAEIAEMREKIANFPEELNTAKEEAAKDAKAKAEKSFAFERRALETEKKHISELTEAELENVKAQVEKLTKEKNDLTDKLDAAYRQMKDMATATVQAGVTVKVASPNEK